jgi:hypothetical protein
MSREVSEWPRFHYDNARSLRTISVVLGVAFSACGATHARVVHDVQGLSRALLHAGQDGDIALAPGTYDNIVIDGVHSNITIHSESSSHKAVIKSLKVTKSSGLTFSDLDFSTEDAPIVGNVAMGIIPFKVLDSSNITLKNLVVHGSPQGALATDVSGILIRNSNHITVAQSEFRNLHWALDHVDDDHLTVIGNHFHNNRDDGVRGGGSSNVLIADNRCDSNHPDGAADTDHPDCIQFWTAHTTVSAHDIMIVGNVYERGTGGATQGIFIRDDVGTLPFHNVIIRGNIMKGSLAGAIEVWGATDVDVVGNLVCSQSGQRAAIVLRGVVGGRLEHNRSPELTILGSDKIVSRANDRSNACTLDPAIKSASELSEPLENF